MQTTTFSWLLFSKFVPLRKFSKAVVYSKFEQGGNGPEEIVRREILPD